MIYLAALLLNGFFLEDFLLPAYHSPVNVSEKMDDYLSEVMEVGSYNRITFKRYQNIYVICRCAKFPAES